MLNYEIGYSLSDLLILTDRYRKQTRLVHASYPASIRKLAILARVRGSVSHWLEFSGGYF